MRPGRGLGALAAAAGISSLGDGAFLAAAPLAAAAVTRDPVAVAVVAAAEYLPWVLVSPYAGVYVDRWRKRSVLVVSDVLRATAVVALAVVAALGLLSIPILAAVAFAVVAGTVFHDAAAQAVVADLTARDPEQLDVVNGRLSAASTGGRQLLGPPAGGALFAAAPWLPFAFDAASFAASGLLLRALPVGEVTAASADQSVLTAMKAGARFLVRHRELRALCLLLAAANFTYNLAWSTLVLYVTDEGGLDLGQLGFGLLLSALAVGGVAGGVLAPRVIKALGGTRSVVLGLIAEAAAWPAIAATNLPLVAAAALALAGLSASVVTVVAMSARQRAVPAEMLARVITAFRLVSNGAAPLGAVAGGLVAGVAGLRAPLLVASAVLVATVVLAARFLRIR